MSYRIMWTDPKSGKSARIEAIFRSAEDADETMQSFADKFPAFDWSIWRVNPAPARTKEAT